LRLQRLSCALTLSCLLLGACADTVRENRNFYVVQPHDTLYSIAWRFDLDYHDLARWNNIGPDFRIAVGQTLELSGAASPAPQAPSGAHELSVGRAPQPASAPPLRAGGPGSAGSATAPKWVWPIAHPSPPIPVPGGGILLSGQVGQEIHAACAGRVVYSGTGLRSYGNLIIIKHSENLLSAYAHNRDSLVRDGEEVLAGQLIAHMGEGAPQKPVLYFEIRRNGKPIDPKTMLPELK
jgi:lipoprotein NlpD